MIGQRRQMAAKRRGALTRLAACATLGMALMIGTKAWAEGADVISFATGQSGGTYHAIAEAFQKAVASGPLGILRVEVTETAGSAAALHLLATDRADFALVQADVLYHGSVEKTMENVDKNVRAVGAVMEEAVHIVVRKDLALKTFEDLRSYRVSVGVPGSGTTSSVLDLLKAHGIKPDELDRVYLPDRAALEKLLAGEIDAWITTLAAPSPLVAQALASGKATLLPVRASVLARLNQSDPALREGKIAKETYEGLEAAVPTPIVRTILVTRRDVSEIKVNEMLRVLVDEAERMRSVHPAVGRYAVDEIARDLVVPAHEGAVAFFKSRTRIELPVPIHVGMYVYDVSGLDLKSGCFDVTFGLWFRWNGDFVEINEADGFPFEIVNGRIESQTEQTLERFGPWTYTYSKIIAKVRGNFPLHNYPFDDQVLAIHIEPTSHGMGEVRFVPDDRDAVPLQQRALNESIVISDWTIMDVRHRSEAKRYFTDFGSPIDEASGSRDFSRYTFEIKLSRRMLPYVVKFLVPLILIVLMSFSVFFIHPKEFEVQAAIVITALLSCVAFHLSQVDALPEVGYLVTADKFFLMSYLVIFLALVEVVAENGCFHRGRMDLAETFDRWSRVGFPIIFFGPLLYLMLTS